MSTFFLLLLTHPSFSSPLNDVIGLVSRGSLDGAIIPKEPLRQLNDSLELEVGPTCITQCTPTLSFALELTVYQSIILQCPFLPIIL